MGKKAQPPKETTEPATPKPAEQPKAQDDLTSLRAERDDLLARLQRVSADFANYQKRAHRDMVQARQYANEELVKALLGVLDDMERAMEAARANHAPDDPLLGGMGLVHQKALEILGQFGLEPIETEGRLFDPDEHSAIMQEPSAEHPPRTVLRQLQKGYKFKGRTIRPSSVVVSKVPEGPQAEQQAPPAEQ
jgi:molecular chaperone GrpE